MYGIEFQIFASIEAAQRNHHPAITPAAARANATYCSTLCRLTAPTGSIAYCALTRNRPPKWGVERPRRRGRVRQGYPQALVSSNWHGCLSRARSLCVLRRLVVKVAAERRLMAESGNSNGKPKANRVRAGPFPSEKPG